MKLHNRPGAVRAKSWGWQGVPEGQAGMSEIARYLNGTDSCDCPVFSVYPAVTSTIRLYL